MLRVRVWLGSPERPALECSRGMKAWSYACQWTEWGQGPVFIRFECGTETQAVNAQDRQLGTPRSRQASELNGDPEEI